MIDWWGDEARTSRIRQPIGVGVYREMESCEARCNSRRLLLFMQQVAIVLSGIVAAYLA